MGTRKQLIVILDFSIFILFMLYVWEFIQFTFFEMPMISKIGIMTGYSMLLFGVILSVSIYLVFLEKILKGISYVVAPLVIGIFFTLFIILYDTEFLSISDEGELYAIVIIIWFWLRGYSFSKYFSIQFPLPEHEILKMVVIFPPRKFLDILPFHCYMAILLIFIPYTIRVIWS